MATLSASPNTWNLAYAPNIYTIAGINTGAGEDRYILQVWIDGASVAEFEQSPNPAGVAHFDVSRVLQSYLEPTYVENTTELSDTPKAVISYQVRYGAAAGLVKNWNPTLTAIKHALNGYTNWRAKDWDYVNFMPTPMFEICLCEGINCYDNANYVRSYEFLTNWPTTNASGIKKYKVRSDEYKTLSFVNRIFNWNDGSAWGPNESPFFVKNTFYNATGGIIGIDIKTISDGTGLPVRTDCTDYIAHDFTDSELIGTIAVGPQNIKDGTFTWYNCAYYTVEIYSINGCYITDNGPIPDCDDLATLDEYIGDLIYAAEFHIDDYCQKFEPITISFLNALGAIDYFTMNKRNTYTANIGRNNYKKSIGSWDSSTWNIEETDRGRRVFSTVSTVQMTLQSDWMSDNESKWLEELLSSPHANIYVNGAWEPVVILSSEYQQLTSARNGMFQHEITVQYANDKNIQRG